MSREIRRVPPTWKHPTDSSGAPRPLRDTTLESEVEKRRRWTAGEDPTRQGYETVSAHDWFGPLTPDYYRPNWPDAERTAYQVYETITEGTPISPVFLTREALIRWLVNVGESGLGIGGRARMTPEAAERFVDAVSLEPQRIPLDCAARIARLTKYLAAALGRGQRPQCTRCGCACQINCPDAPTTHCSPRDGEGQIWLEGVELLREGQLYGNGRGGGGGAEVAQGLDPARAGEVSSARRGVSDSADVIGGSREEGVHASGCGGGQAAMDAARGGGARQVAVVLETRIARGARFTVLPTWPDPDAPENDYIILDIPPALVKSLHDDLTAALVVAADPDLPRDALIGVVIEVEPHRQVEVGMDGKRVYPPSLLRDDIDPIGIAASEGRLRIAVLDTPQEKP